MKTTKVIPRKHIPAKMPISSTILYTFLMYYFQASQLLWGIFLTLMLIIWVIIIIRIWSEKIDEELINKPKE